MAAIDANQFEGVAEHYGEMPSLPEGAVLTTTIPSHLREAGISGKRVIDLACGTGRWSRWMCAAGAKEVVGVDKSPAMVTAAQQLSSDIAEREKIHYVVADCAKALVGPRFSEPFDIALAVCFLNYAATEHEMRSMWNVVASSLSPGGIIICLLPNLNLDDDYSVPIDPRYGTSFWQVEPVNINRADWGFKTRFKAQTGHASMEFDMYRLNRDVYKRAAHDAGMHDVHFHSMMYPDDDCRPSDYWDEYKRRPHYEILTAKR